MAATESAIHSVAGDASIRNAYALVVGRLDVGGRHAHRSGRRQRQPGSRTIGASHHLEHERTVRAKVSGAGNAVTVTAVDDGAAVVTASVGAVSATIPLTVRRVVTAIRLTIPDTVLVFGSVTRLRAVALDARQQEMPAVTGFRYSTSEQRMTAV